METQFISKNKGYTTSFYYKIKKLDWYERLKKDYLDRQNKYYSRTKIR